MSARSFKRAHARRVEREHRRLTTLRRKGAIAAGTALTASVLFAATADAQTLTVTTLNDDAAGGTCTAGQCTTLRDAVSQANSDASADTITFPPGLTGAITLTNGALSVAGSSSFALTITGPGADAIAVSGNNVSQVFTVDRSNTVSISGLTMTDGNAGTSPGGAIYNEDDETSLSLSDDVISNSTTADTSDGGGGVYVEGGLTLSGTQVTGNKSTAGSGGGIYSASKYGVKIKNSTISGNTATSGGGIQLAGSSGEVNKYDSNRIDNSTISGNQATDGAGLAITELGQGEPTTIDASTISGNTGGADSFGGGLLLVGDINSPFELVDSTISGNTAATGGGVSLGDSATPEPLLNTSTNPNGSISFENSTIASNTATTAGGGIFMSDYLAGSPATEQNGTADITSTIVAGNTAAAGPRDLAVASGSTSPTAFAGAFSLIEDPGSAPLSKQQVITGESPDLGPLSNNGGPTETMLPSGTSPVIDQGRAPNSLSTDQRGDPRTVDISGIPRPPGGDGSDIGSVELPASSVPVVLSATLRSTLLSSAVSPLLPGSASPIDCSVRVGVLTSCVVHVVVGGKLLADGDAQAPAGSTTLAVSVNPTAAGLKAIAKSPLGITAPATITSDGNGGPQVTGGNVHLLAGPLFTLPTGKTATKTVSKSVQGELKQVAQLLKGAGAKSATCTAYTKKGPHKGKNDKSVTAGEAKAACSYLGKDGFKDKTTSAGKGHSIAANQLVISFKF
jgi:hypothetical protein